MQALLDHLAAIVAGTVLLGILAAVGLQQQSESVRLAEHQFSAGRSAALADWLRGDLQSLTAVTACTGSRLVFTRVADPSTGLMRVVEYLLVCPSGESVCRIVRREGGTEHIVDPSVSGFHVTMLDRVGQATIEPGRTVALRVRVLTPVSLTGRGHTRGAIWERTFTPRMLGRPTV